MERPKGITIIAILEIVFGTLGTISGIINLFMASLLPFLSMQLGNEIINITLTLTALTLSVLALIGGIGLLKLKKWGRFMVMTIALFSIVQILVSQILTYLEIGPIALFGMVFALIGVTYYLVIFFYLKQKKHHHLFDLASEETNKGMEGELDKLAQQPVPPQPPTQ